MMGLPRLNGSGDDFFNLRGKGVNTIKNSRDIDEQLDIYDLQPCIVIWLLGQTTISKDPEVS